MSPPAEMSLERWLSEPRADTSPPLSPADVGRPLAHALAALHSTGMIHGGLSAKAVLVNGSGQDARLGAFSPQPGDGAIDVHGLGLLLLQLSPWQRGAAGATVQLAGLEQALDRESRSGSAAIDPVAGLLQRMLQPDPTRRPTMNQVATELDRLAAASQDVAQAMTAPVATGGQKGRIGQLLGSYRISGLLGEGGMGQVYEAQHLRLSRRAAIKLLRPELSQNPEMVQRFFNEAESVNVVQHPGIVTIFEFGQLPDQTVFIVMEYLAGESLGKRLARIGAPLGMDAVRILRQIASALAAAHAHGIVHRDLKPENVMIVSDPDVPGGERAKLLDFGIAKMAADSQGEASPNATRSGAMMGTPSYMSPEQIRDTGSVDDRADVYSLGVMCYQALGGKLPFSAPSFYELAMLHFNAAPQPLRELDPRLPGPLCALVERMLAKEAAGRPPMAEVAATLDQLLAPTPESRSAQTQALTVKPPRRLWSLGLVAIGLSVAGLVSYELRPTPRPRALATPDLAPLVAAAPVVDLALLRERSLGVVQEGLRDADPSMRRRAVAVLGQSRDVRVAPLGEPLLADADPVVQAQAADALWQLGARGAVPALLRAAEDKGLSEALRVEVAGALWQLGAAQGEQLLQRALRSKAKGAEGDRLRSRASLYLAARGDARARRLLLDAPLDEDQVLVLGRLARFGDEEALLLLRRNLAAPGEAAPSELQLRTAAELARCDDEDGRRLLERVARGDGPQRLRAARLLAQLDDPSFYDLFRARFQAAAAPLPERVVAAEGLGATGLRSGAALLAEALPKAVGVALRLRLAAAGAILQIVASDPELLAQESLARIQQRLGETDRDERAVASAALGEADPVVAVPLLSKVVKDPEASVRASAARALGRTGARAAVPVLTGVLDDQAPVVRRQAMASMGTLGEHLRRRGEPVDEVVKTMAAHATQGDEEDRLASVATLVRLGQGGHDEELQRWLGKSDVNLRLQAIAAFAAAPGLATGAVLERLVALLSDKVFAVRFAAAGALAQRGRKEGVAVLREGLAASAPAPLVARARLVALGEAVPGTPALLGGSIPERVAQVEVAGQLPASQALSLLFQAARDVAQAVRLKVLEVLSESPTLQQAPPARRLVKVLLADPDSMVRSRAGLLLRRLPEQRAKAAGAAPDLAPAAVLPDLGTAGEMGGEPEPGPAPGAAPDLAAASEGATRAQRGHIEVDAAPEVRFQIDRQPEVTAPTKPIAVSAGRHRVRYLGGSIDIDVPAGGSVSVKVPVTTGEQALTDALAAFDSGDKAAAQRLLARARQQLKGKASRAQLYSLAYVQGRIHEEQRHFVEAMTEYERLSERVPEAQLSAAQRAELSAAVARTAARLGRVQVSEPVDGRCQTKVLWLEPGPHTLDIGGASREIRVRPGETLKVQACQ